VFDDSDDFSPAVKAVGNNVVSISGKKSNVEQIVPSAPPSLSRLPAPVQRVREKAGALFQQALKALFEGADDALFDLADKANSNHDQNTYFEAMREVRLKRRDIEKNFFALLDTAYADLLRAVPEREQGFGHNLTLDDLTLLGNDQLEFQVAVESMISKVLDQCAESAQHIALRLDSLVPVKVYQQNNPVGPHLLCHSFWKVIEPLDAAIKAKLVLLKLFDKALMAHLSKVYTILNELLIEENVLPSLTTQAYRRQRRQQAANAARAAQSAKEEHLLEEDLHSEFLQHSPSAQSPVAATRSYDDTAPISEQDPLLEQLRDLLAAVVASGSQGARSGQQGQMAPGFLTAASSLAAHGTTTTHQRDASAVVGSGELARVLTALQQQHYQQTSSVQRGAASLVDAAQLSQMLQQPLGKDKSLSAVDQDVMSLINMLFQFILDDRNLAAPMQGMLARLQIPMLKVAVVDKSFFNRSAHPARRLLNELATAALGWQEPEKGLEKDPLFKKVASTVESIIADFDDDVAIFDGLLTDFMAFVEKEKRRATVLEKRTVDAEDGKAKSDFARAQVNEQLQALIQGRELPSCVREILEGPWHNLMFLLLLKNGTDSEAWKKACQVVEDLTWSVTAVMDGEARKQLMGMLPALLKSLRQGFEVISYSPFEMNSLLQQLETEHLRRLREPEVVAAPVLEPAAAEIVPAVATEEAAVKASVEEVVLKEAAVKETVVKESAVTEITDKETIAEDAAEASAEQVSLVEPVVEPSSEAVIEPAVAAELAVSAAWLGQVDRFAQGSWFEVAEEGRPVFRCRLAAVIKKADKYIFVNRNGMKVAEKTRLELAQALERGVFNLLDDGMLFDRALESVISNLRKSRN
jgi:hypothetical protein